MADARGGGGTAIFGTSFSDLAWCGGAIMEVRVMAHDLVVTARTGPFPAGRSSVAGAPDDDGPR